MSLINEDCLSLIFEELHDDRSSLYSCLLVNKIWCKFVVPILWRDPWNFLNILKDSTKDKLFLNTLLLHLPEESKNYLKNQDNNSINIPQQRHPLFNYVSFIKYIRQKYKSLDIEIIYNPSYNYELKSLLEQEIYKLLISKCTLKFLDITKVKCPLYKYPGATDNLSCICELHCRSYDDQELLYGLAQICRFIERLCILYENSNPGLANLIEVQKNLKYIKILVNSFTNFNNVKLKSKCRIIDQAIIKQSHNLIYLDMPIENINITFYNELFPKLVNLQKLILDGNMLYDTESEKKLIFSTYPKLQVLLLDSVLFFTAKGVIQNSEGNLQIIWTNNICFSTADQSRNFIQIICQNCPRLKYVKLLLKGQYFDEIEQLLMNCQHLEGLYIDADTQINNRRGDELLDKLIKSAPNSLFKIQLNYFEFEMKNFDSFFIKWRCRRSLWLYLNNVNVKSDDDFKVEFKDLIEKYKNEGVIKKYEFNNSLNFINYYKEL
ncbi:hypothetical protein C1645_820104 [Glomus cerebriforme]|uniref:F-box domain-containing protein n=1 Tax=Glomus cerebriforme TaxID=658196 RepID=A0A397T3M1_9GLOM|nr:hypothetical protein C1645_820104 [Glomus cerebriforme]